ncbi:hypothetical protein TRFO_38791 [Tritrichomonas foetus]|uniref:DUF3447 domain-containing protein n=1 Tax=Tritrichomonas foetus TaxID=1144522 RepID=A0A1J4J8M8_9EUKA|nr:hypothetical protein TRFO_38791 [Tritrichomonas foetus]|eukprot:OHS95049.1 hypothetical protein TRFO_38791 [Tritrichomonas foetus]
MMDITENTQTCTPFLKFNTPFYQIPSLVPKNNEISVEQLKENNFELHKKYCTLGISTDRIFQVLMNDDYDELQKYASELGFNVNGKFLHFNTSLVNIFNQIKIFNYITEDRDMYNRLNIIKFPPKYINICAYFGSKRCFDFLKINKAEIAQDTLIYAIAGGSVEIIREIEAELVDLDQQTCQLYAICFHQNDIFEWLCNKYGIIGTEILLKHCIKYYNYKALLFLISEGADVQNLIYNSLKNHNFTLLHLAMNLHYLKNPFKVKEGPLNLAIRRNHIDIIKKMMMLQQAKEAVDFQSNIGTPFSCAIENENYEIISALLEINNSVYNQTFSVMLNAYSLVKFTPLTYSLYLNKYDITTMLLTFPNININDVDSENFTPLHLACMNDQIEIVKTLLSSDEIEINKVNNKDECPVHIAIRKCYNKIAKLLIDHDKIDFDASENPILVAIKFKNAEIVKYLLPLLKFNISDKDLYVLFFI